MKRTLLALFLALALPIITSAQQSSVPAAGMMQMHAQMRTKILGLLTPEQKTLLAKVVGQLAIAPNPDLGAAASQLDAALSPTQKQTILSRHQAMMKQMQSMRDGMMAHSMGGMKTGGMKAGGMCGGKHGMNDPGVILIMMATHWGPMGPGK